MMTMNLAPNQKARIRLTLFCMATLLIGGPSLAADENGAPPAVQTDQNIESLLQMIEQKISTNHTSSPAGDSAVDAWKQVIRVIPATDSARVRNALTTFTVHMRRRAAEEQKAGNITVSEDMSVFASQAEGIRAHAAALRSGAPKTDAEPRVVEQRPGDAGVTSPAAPKFEPLAGSLPRIVPPDVHLSEEPQMAPPANSTTPAANVVPLTTGPPQGTMKPSEAEFYAWRGDLMLAMKDVPAARKYYELAANGGSARAAVQLARINDPAFVLPSNVEPKTQQTQHLTQDHSPRRRAHIWRAGTPTAPQPAADASDATVPMNGSARP